jgi:hypothetical protein
MLAADQMWHVCAHCAATVMDEMHRAHRVYRHVLHQPHDRDQLLLEEHDPSVFMDVSRTKDQVRPLVPERLRMEVSGVVVLLPSSPPILDSSRFPKMSFMTMGTALCLDHIEFQNHVRGVDFGHMGDQCEAHVGTATSAWTRVRSHILRLQRTKESAHASGVWASEGTLCFHSQILCRALPWPLCHGDQCRRGPKL